MTAVLLALVLLQAQPTNDWGDRPEGAPAVSAGETRALALCGSPTRRSSVWVFRELGEPDSDRTLKCKPEGGKPWTCRVWTYRVEGWATDEELLVYFVKDGVWWKDHCRKCKGATCKEFPFSGR